MKNRFRHLLPIVCVLSWATMTACDSGDIYPDETPNEQGISIGASFILRNTEVFPVEYNLIFGVFAEGGTAPLASVNVIQPNGDTPLSLKLENIPEEATSVKLGMVNSGRQLLYTFFEQSIDDSNPSQIVIPETEIDLLPYDRIQQLVFQQYNCVSCHQGTTGSAGLLLTQGLSYPQLVNTPSTLSDKPRVTPSDPENSFLLDVLSQQEAVGYPHTGLITRSEDLAMLRIWIEKGCPQ